MLYTSVNKGPMEGNIMKTYDLTQGDLSAHLVRLAIPLMLGNILQQLYNTIDAMVVGRYAGGLEFAAIGVSSSVMNLFIFIVVGACTGISVLFSQQYGARDLETFRRQHFLTLVFGLLAAAVMSLASIFLLPALLKVIQTPEEILSYTKTYLVIVLASLPASFLYNLYSALLRSVGSTRAALAVLASAVVINLILDLVLVAGFHLGIAGAAWATAAAQFFSAALCILYLRLARPELLFNRADCRMDGPLLRRTAHFSFVTALHQSGLYIGKLLVQGAVNSMGTDLISAYTATTRIEAFANSIGDSSASATSVLIAQNLGANRKDRAQQGMRRAMLIFGSLGLFSGALMFLFAPQASALLLGAGSGVAFENSCAYLRTVSLFYILCFTGSTFVGYFDGRGNVSIPLVGACSHISMRAALSWLWIRRLKLPAVALGTGIGWVWVNLFWTLCYFYLQRKQEKVKN